MKRKIFNLIGLFILMLFPLVTVNATDGYFDIGNNTALDANHSYFVAGNNVRVSGRVRGINLIAGNNITTDANSEYGFIAGNFIEIGNTIEKDLFVVGNSLKLNENTEIMRDLYAVGSTIQIKGKVHGNAFAGASVITLENATIDGDLNVSCGTLQIVGSVNIAGKLIINDDAVITNENNLNVSSKDTYETKKVELSISIGDIVISVLSLIFTGIILALIFPKLFSKIDKEFSVSNVGKLMLYGLLFLIITPIVIILSMATIVGITFGILLTLFYIIACLIGMILASYVLGNYIYTKLIKKKDNIYISIIVGVFVSKLISYIPYIGGFIYLLLFLYGIGIIWNLLLDRNK